MYKGQKTWTSVTNAIFRIVYYQYVINVADGDKEKLTKLIKVIVMFDTYILKNISIIILNILHCLFDFLRQSPKQNLKKNTQTKN